MASQKAKQIDFLIAGYANSSGQPYKAGKVYFWESSSKTTSKTVWQDRNKANAYSQPVVLGNSGEATVFGDGEYYIEIYDKNDVLVKTFDLINYSAEVDFGGLYIDVASLYGTSGPNIQAAIDDLETTLNYVLLFKDADFAVSQDITIPSNVVLKAMPTANIEVAQSITLTINGSVDAGYYQVFSGEGTVVIPNSKPVLRVWGVTNDQITDLHIDVGLEYGFTAANIQSCLDDLDSSINYGLLFRNGEFTIDADLTFPSNVVLKGHINAYFTQSNSSTITIESNPDIPFSYNFFRGTVDVEYGTAVTITSQNWIATDDVYSAQKFLKNIALPTKKIDDGYTENGESLIEVDCTNDWISILLTDKDLCIGQSLTIIKIDDTDNKVEINPRGSESVIDIDMMYLRNQFDSVTLQRTSNGIYPISFFSDRLRFPYVNETWERFSEKKWFSGRSTSSYPDGGVAVWNLTMDAGQKVQLLSGGCYSGRFYTETQRPNSSNDSLTITDVAQDSYDPDNIVSESSTGLQKGFVRFAYTGASLYFYYDGEASETDVAVSITFIYGGGTYLDVEKDPDVVDQ